MPSVWTPNADLTLTFACVDTRKCVPEFTQTPRVTFTCVPAVVQVVTYWVPVPPASAAGLIGCRERDHQHKALTEEHQRSHALSWRLHMKLIMLRKLFSRAETNVKCLLVTQSRFISSSKLCGL